VEPQLPEPSELGATAATVRCDDDDDDFDDTPYDMTPARGDYCGLCVVFNIVNFTVALLKKREGSEHDGDTIKKTFR
jgi:hypothetical protein